MPIQCELSKIGRGLPAPATKWSQEHRSESVLQKCRSLTIALFLTLVVSLSSVDGAKAQSQPINDPLEPLNRAVFAINQTLDGLILRPLAILYTSALPEFARKGIRNFFQNLETPILLANDLMQGDINAAQVTSIRFAINSTVGFLGFLDPAANMGYPRRDEDFGQTLGKWGIGPGIYIVLPILGPSSLRDSLGLGVDQLLDPFLIHTSSSNLKWVSTTRAGIRGIDARGRHLDVLDKLERTSIDYYATLRSLYMQRRESQILNGRTTEPPSLELESGDDIFPPPKLPRKLRNPLQ